MSGSAVEGAGGASQFTSESAIEVSSSVAATAMRIAAPFSAS
jgi:hypothetical protein